jgi:hypothetical protein
MCEGEYGVSSMEFRAMKEVLAVGGLILGLGDAEGAKN